MNPTIEIIICAIVAALLPGGIMLLNERRRTRIAEARLTLAKAATGADRLMLAGEIKIGEVCHDYVCNMIFATQGVKSFNVDWNPFLRLTEEQVKFQRLLEKELASNHGMCETMNLYVRGFAKAFRNSHPIKFTAFSLWVIFFRGGLTVLIVALRGAEGLLLAWCKAKLKIAEWSVVCGQNRQMCR